MGCWELPRGATVLKESHGELLLPRVLDIRGGAAAVFAAEEPRRVLNDYYWFAQTTK